MKKCLLLLCLLVGIQHAFAVTTQGHWRWRKDDGSQTTATWLAEESTPISITGYDNLRVRIEHYSGIKNVDLSNLALEYSLTGNKDSAKQWTLISDTVANHAFVLATSATVADGTATTQQLTARPNYTFVPGRVISSRAAFTYKIDSAYSTEFEFVIKPTATVAPGTTYYFRCTIGAVETTYPSLTTAAVLPVNLISFGVTDNAGKALVKWTTASEVNSDHFEVLRSQNGQSWQAIATIKAKGTNSVQNSYEFTDNTPLAGSSYYRLKQVDKDGKATLSDVKNFSLKNLKNIVASIYPNPTAAVINVMMNSYTGNVTATVTSTQGAVVHRQVIAVTASTSAYKLSLNQKLAPGTYYVNLNGTDLSQNLKVVVQ